jgi:diacylglycerol kinase family enzyme
MDQIKLNAQFANDVSNENAENQAPASHGANEIRTLNDFELVIAGGGDGIVVW